MAVMVKTKSDAGKDRFWGILSISATFIGTVVGAGFASGQEIYQFFSRYGPSGFLGIITAVIVMGWTGGKVFGIGHRIRPRSYHDFLVYILGRRFTPVIDLILFTFFIILIAVMFAGSGSIFETMGLSFWSGVILTAIMLVGVLFFDLPGLISANLLVIPLMFAGSLGISLYGVIKPSADWTTANFSWSWFPATLQFSAYNLVLAIPVLLSLAKEYPKGQLKCGGWLGSLVLGMIACFINWALLCHQPHIRSTALPMVELARPAGILPYLGYIMILWGEMFTTLLANTYGAVQRLAALTGWPYRIWLPIVALTGVIIARIGFVNLIAGCYPVFGYLCLVILVLIAWKK